MQPPISSKVVAGQAQTLDPAATSAYAQLAAYARRMNAQKASTPFQTQPSETIAHFAQGKHLTIGPDGNPTFTESAAMQLPQQDRSEKSGSSAILDQFLATRRMQEEEFKKIQETSQTKKNSRPVSVYPEPTADVLKNNQAFIKEGIWSNAPNTLSLYPFPKESTQAWNEKSIFLHCLSLIEGRLLSSPSCVIEAKTLDRCKICGVEMGNKVDFVDSSNRIMWSKNYRHYIDKHNIQPSNYFRYYIIQAANQLFGTNQTNNAATTKGVGVPQTTTAYQMPQQQMSLANPNQILGAAPPPAAPSTFYYPPNQTRSQAYSQYQPQPAQPLYSSYPQQQQQQQQQYSYQYRS